jgi:hypothetical protein
MKPSPGRASTIDPETEDTDPIQRPSLQSVVMVTAVAELGLLPVAMLGFGWKQPQVAERIHQRTSKASEGRGKRAKLTAKWS